jgi:ubiquinone/menaquinone biosynthesis C-methylase UbiE
MSSQLTDENYLRNEQYKNAANLTARIDLHQLFSVNKQGWFRWVFEQLDLPADARILEIGCGRGDLWRENIERIPAGWRLTLTDFAAGMLAETKDNLAAAGREIKFETVDIRCIPFAAGTFDAVLANHMLYHVPDRPAAFLEVIRVLAPGGKFHATTVGEKHMAELTALVREFYGNASAFDFDSTQLDFLLENGQAQLEPFFSDLEMRRYPDKLSVTQPAPLVNYVRSGRLGKTLEQSEREFTRFVSGILEVNGPIHIMKDSGIFIARGS